MHRLAYNGDVAAGQLAVFQGASEAPISGSIRAGDSHIASILAVETRDMRVSSALLWLVAIR